MATATCASVAWVATLLFCLGRSAAPGVVVEKRTFSEGLRFVFVAGVDGGGHDRLHETLGRLCSNETTCESDGLLNGLLGTREGHETVASVFPAVRFPDGGIASSREAFVARLVEIRAGKG